MVIKLDDGIIFTWSTTPVLWPKKNSDANADARSVCSSWSSCWIFNRKFHLGHLVDNKLCDDLYIERAAGDKKNVFIRTKLY